jgi:RNA polymerase sigma factor (sigma-70 family)
MMASMDCDKKLAKALAKGNADEVRRASAEVFESYKNLIYAIALGILGNKEEAEDALIESFTSFYSALTSAGAVTNPKYYLATAVRHIAYRMKEKGERGSELDEENAGQNEEHTEDFEAFELSDKLRKLWNKEEAEIVVDHVIYDLSFREIGAKKNKSLFAISGLYARAIKKAKEGLEDEKD